MNREKCFETKDIDYIYGLMNALLYESEDSLGYSYKPGSKEEGFAYYDKCLQNIRQEIDWRFRKQKDIRNKLYRLVEEEEELIKSYSQPGVPARWLRANPRLRFYDCVFDFIEECPELYDQIRSGEVITWWGQEVHFSFYPTKEECKIRKAYFAELEEKNAKQNRQYSYDRFYQNELVNTLRMLFESDFDEE